MVRDRRSRPVPRNPNSAHAEPSRCSSACSAVEFRSMGGRDGTGNVDDPVAEAGIGTGGMPSSVANETERVRSDDVHRHNRRIVRAEQAREGERIGADSEASANDPLVADAVRGAKPWSEVQTFRHSGVHRNRANAADLHRVSGGVVQFDPACSSG